jgi:hypothetical protein
LSAACDLLGVTSAATTSAPKVISSLQRKTASSGVRVATSISATPAVANQYSLDLAKPRTVPDYALFRKNVVQKIVQIKEDGTAATTMPFMDDLIHDLIEELPLTDVKKLIGWTQTLYNRKSSGTSSGGGKKKPALKYGGSMKTSFEHGLKQDDLDDFDEYY